MRTIKRGNRGSGDGGTKGGAAAAATGPAEFDMSVTSTPEEWLAAQRDSGLTHDDTPLNQHQGMTLVPKGRRASLFNVAISALIGSLVSGAAWYWLDTSGLYTGPWIAVVIGAFIAVVVRAVSGGAESTFQAALATGVYLLTLAATLLLITRRDLTEIYGPIGDFQVYEDNIIQTRLQEPVQVLAFLLGAFAAIQVSYLLRERDD